MSLLTGGRKNPEILFFTYEKHGTIGQYIGLTGCDTLIIDPGTIAGSHIHSHHLAVFHPKLQMLAADAADIAGE